MVIIIRQPLGERGDYNLSNNSNLFRNDCNLDYFRMENLGKPKIFNIVELGPGWSY